jgi:nucleosome binding factor SPN SPT16 subunit
MNPVVERTRGRIQVGGAQLMTQQYLLGYEFPSTLIVFHKSPRRVTFVGSASKAKIINQLKTSNGIEIDMQVRGKDEASARECDVGPLDSVSSAEYV